MFPESQNTSDYESIVGNQQPQTPAQNPAQEPGSTTDYEAMLAEHRETIQQQGQQLQGLHGEVDRFRKSTQNTEGALDRIKRAISGEDAPKVDPRTQRKERYENDMDMFLAEGLKAEKQGRGIPLTTKVGTDFYQFAMAAEAREAESASKLQEMQEKIDHLSNPERNLDNQAGTAMEGHLQSAMATVYGEADDYADVRSSQFDATSRLIVQEITALKAENPDAWNRIRRDPTAQRKMVSHFVKKVIPPKARELLENEHIQNTPMSNQELWTAFRQAKELYIKNPSDQLDEVMQNLRAKLLEGSMPGAGQKGRGTANRLMSGGF